MARHLPRTDNGTAQTLAELARAVGRSTPTVSNWRTYPGWPFSTRPPWDVEAVKKWAAGLRPNRNVGGVAEPAVQVARDAIWSDERQARHALTVQRARRAKAEADLITGKSHDVAECEARSLRKIYAVKHGLLALPRTLTPLLVGLSDPVRMETILRDAVRTLLLDFAEGHLEAVPEAGTIPGKEA